MADTRNARAFAALLRHGMAYMSHVLQAYERELGQGQAPDFKVCQGLAAALKTLGDTLSQGEAAGDAGVQVVIGLPRPEPGKEAAP